jgi:RNA polymerase sigma-70 factor (ECF subfamily)
MEDQNGHNSWKTWFERHGPRLLLCARQWTRTASDAEDVLQEAFVRFWRHQRKLGGEPLGLILTSVRRAAVDLARRDQRRLSRETEAGKDDNGEDPTPLFVSTDGNDDRRKLIEQALRRLPPAQREVLVLKIWGEQTFAEIATQLGESPNTVASRYRYALATLRQELTAADCHG